MAENVVLSVQLSGADAAIGQLTQLDALLKSVKASGKVNVSVNSKGLATAAADAEKLSTGLSNAGSAAKQMGGAGAKGVNAASDALGKASRNAESFRLGMGSVVANMAKFRIASAAINFTMNAFKDAFKEMKNVDSELVNIRKVTGFANDEIEKLSKSAYSLASNYGRSASEVLQASTVFARAGYTEQIEQLSELSLLLQNVGDLQAEDASKFVIATDKAYKLGGSYEDLMKIIDGLDNITNKNATDMQKMTEGMTIAGSVFAESGESVEMFAALLGTATANTQRSGSEVARGLRTILMNLRQIRGETEDGELIDGESIAAAAKALKDYAGISTMENGQLRKASDVLTELAGKWDTLSETQRAAIAEAVAGKRQANILMSLMGDWESVVKMMQEYEDAAGTAAQENAMYMDSWAAKTAQVKSAWTELVATIVDSDAVKGVLDGIIAALDVINETISPDFNPSGEIENRDADAYRNTISLQSSLSSGMKQFTSDWDTKAFVSSMNDAVSAGQEFYNTLQQMKQAGTEWTSQEENFVQAFDALNNGLENGESAFQLYGYAVAASMLSTGSSAEESAAGANSELAALKEKIDELPEEKQINIVLTVSGGLKGLLGFASGTRGAPGGPALVNENGPEMISANGLAWIAGGGKPTVTMLPRGATVLTAQQTRSATSGRNISGIPAYAGGTVNPTRSNNMTDEGGQGRGPSPGPNAYWWAVPESEPKQYITANDLNGTTFSGRTGSKYRVKYCPVCGTPNPTGAPRCVACGFNFLAAESREKNKDSNTDYYSSGAPVSAPPNFKKLEDDLAKRLKNLDAQAKLAENEGDLLKAMQVYGTAQDAIAELLEQYRANGYAEDSDEVLRLANLGYDYAAKQLGGYDQLQKNLIDALNALTESTDKANELAERQEAVEKAREALANAERQRTVRIFNPVTGQWEWVANAADVQKAQENLKSAEESLKKEEFSQAVDAIKNAKPEELGNMSLSPAILEALFGGSPEQQSAFLNALGAATGGADWLASSAAQTAWNQGTSIGTQYNLNGIELTEAQAAGMTIKDLIALLQGLKIM